MRSNRPGSRRSWGIVSGPANAPISTDMTSSSIAAIFSTTIAAASGAVVGVLGLRDGDEVGDEAQPLHLRGALLAVAGERSAVTGAVEHEVADDAGVAQWRWRDLAR